MYFMYILIFYVINSSASFYIVIKLSHHNNNNVHLNLRIDLSLFFQSAIIDYCVSVEHVLCLSNWIRIQEKKTLHLRKQTTWRQIDGVHQKEKKGWTKDGLLGDDTGNSFRKGKGPYTSLMKSGAE